MADPSVNPLADPDADKEFPKWMYGPHFQSAVFERDEPIPEGWQDHPSKVEDTEGPMIDPPHLDL